MEGEDHSKDVDFSPDGISQRWAAGLADTRRVLHQAPCNGRFYPVEGFILHEASAGEIGDKGIS